MKQMKCSDFYSMKQEIHNQEKQELVAALKAVGGSYEWAVEDDNGFQEPMPSVCVLFDSGPADIGIKRIRLDDSQTFPIIDGIDLAADDDEVDVNVDDIMVGHIGFIIEMITPNGDIDDVSTPMDYNKFMQTNIEFIETLQEITSQATFTLRNINHGWSREQVLEMCRQWAVEFHNDYANDKYDWESSEKTYWETIDWFVDMKIQQLGFHLPEPKELWTLDEVINCQYITAWGTDKRSIHWDDDWLFNFDDYRKWALEFSTQEPADYEMSDTDYESAMTKFLNSKMP